MKRTNTPQTFDISTLMVIPSEQETQSSYESSQATASQELNDTLILVSNSVLDGFREGDGDLMDKIVIHLNRKGILAKRIVENSDKIPANKREQVSLGQLVALGDKTQCDNETLQNKLLDIIQQHTDKTIILYIGSRLDVVDMHQEQPMRAGSGSLYTKEFLQELQSRKVKIVICCLEFKFFKRSLSELPKAYEMLRQQLFLADSIHFLTAHDKSNFEKTLDALKTNTKLYPHKLVPFQSEQLARFDLEKDIKELGGIDIVLKQKDKGVFISGIYTVEPLTEQDIFTHANMIQPLHERFESTLIQILSEREANILCFGLIRKNKGIDEAIALANQFEENRLPNKVIIVGKIMEASTGYFVSLISGVYGLSGRQVKKAVIEVLSDLQKAGHELIPNDVNVQKIDFAKLNEIIFKGDKESMNDVFQQAYDRIKADMLNKQRLASIEFCFNASEEAVKDIAMKCRWAMKLDHKGMANNASTIVSCLGMYLPTFTASGLVTGDEFRDPEHHRRSHGEHNKQFGRYRHTLFMPKKDYLPLDTTQGEIKPMNASVDAIFNIIIKQTPDGYRKCLQQLRQLHKDNVFDTEHVVDKLITDIFVQLSQPEESVGNNFPLNR